jgi:hypothetical protein
LTKKRRFNNFWFFQGHAEVAQSVEQGTENPRVGSSILSLGTKKFKRLAIKLGRFFVFNLACPHLVPILSLKFIFKLPTTAKFFNLKVGGHAQYTALMANKHCELH